MANVICEFCKYEQDDEVSKICDNCGRRLTRTSDVAPIEKQPVKSRQAEESSRCPICGVAGSNLICSNCGNPKRPRTV